MNYDTPWCFIEDDDGEIIKRRSGTPYTNAYKQLRTQLFLPNLRQVRAGSSLNPSIMFVQRDLLNAFFSWAPGGRDFALSAAPMALFEPVTPREHVLPGLASPHRPEAAAVPHEQVAFVGRQAGVTTNSSLRESVASPRSTISSQYTQVMSPQPRAYSDLSRGMEETWSQFSLPNLGVSDSEDDGGELENQRQRSLPSLTEDRRSFPEVELRDEEDDRRSLPPLQDAGAWSLASTNNADRRSFPELEFQDGLRDERRSFPEPEIVDENDGRRSFPELELIDDEHRSSPTTNLQGTDVWSSVSTNSNHRSFPELEFRNGDMRVEHRLFPTTDLQRTDILSIASTDDSGRRSFPELDLQASNIVDGDGGRRLFPAVEVQSTSTDSWAERRSFPALELPDIEAPDGRRSFSAPELHGHDTSRPYGAVDAPRPLTNREMANQ